MNIVEKEAVEYAEYEFFNGELNCTVDNLSSDLSSKLYSLKRKKDKLFFLNILRKEVLNQKLEHEKTCSKVNCGTSQEKETGLFVIDQEIEEISQSYEYQPKYTEEFSSEQKSELHNSLNEIKEKLTELGFGQQIIFDELDELKEHLNLGKKNWFQLLKGKLFDLTVSKALEETVIKEVYETLSDGFEDLPNLIENL
ncbi:hypothetical protein [Aequorivita xiaoshiensis]|uniref:Uncharacterized protein n=1 Tax=Aequorivita xiaoshiensis TaxID=2874476 RepID=A0A9X1R0L5_9FLAO|nr:hypothetical protein [Aequorivita xiaoshiensis]MCG2432171.1 hypothetical protein [Aequorivita xiaoshiensis]